MTVSPGGERFHYDPDRMVDRPVGMPDNAAVSIDDGPAFRCFDGGHRWNGFVCPMFSRWSAQKVIDWMTREQAENPIPEYISFAWDGDTIVVTEGVFADEPDYSPLRVEPDATGRYGLGDGWVWTLADAEVHRVLLRDTRAEDARAQQGYPFQPVVVFAPIGADCPVCGGPRGLPHRIRREEGGVGFTVDTWTNPCGHVDTLPEVLAEAGLR